MRARNAAILAKLCWRIASSPDAPWALLLTSKYLTPTRLGERRRRLPASSTWAACKDGGVIFNKGLKWSISNEEAVSAWDDFWHASGPLRKLIQGPLLEGKGKKSAKEFLANVFDSSFVFPDSILKEIQGAPLAANPLQDDILIWGFSKDGRFNL